MTDPTASASDNVDGQASRSPSPFTATDPTEAKDGLSPEPDAPVAEADKKRPSMTREIIETLLLALVIFVLVRAVVLNFKVDGHSMDPSFDNGEMLLVNRNAYFNFGTSSITGWIPGISDDLFLFHAPQRGDVIVFNPPIEDNDKPYIKRIIGVAGDTVETRNGHVFVNGQLLDELYIDGKQTVCGGQDCAPVVVPESDIFVMGDNRTNSSDSRVFGPVPVGNVIGKAWVTYWPKDDIGVVPHYEYPDVPQP